MAKEIEFNMFEGSAIIYGVMQRPEAMQLTRDFLMSRFARLPDTNSFKYMDTLIRDADRVFISTYGEAKDFEIKAIALSDGNEVTFFASRSHPVITFRFMEFIIEKLGKVECETNVEKMERLLIKLKFKPVDQINGGTQYIFIRPTDMEGENAFILDNNTVH